MRMKADILRVIARTPDFYLRATCLMRADIPGRIGSFFPGLSTDDVERLVREAPWEPYDHPEVQAPAVAFIARNIPGRMAVFPLEELPDDAQLTFNDSKGTGFVEAVWVNAPQDAGHDVDHVTLIAGPEDEENEEDLSVWTFFPGDPVEPSSLEDPEGIYRDKNCDVETARQLGVQWVKVSSRSSFA